MELFILVLSGSFALAAVAALWIFSHGRTASERRLAALGFEPCDSDAPALERVWRALTGCEASQELHVDHCKGRAVGWGMMHHFTVRQRPARERNGDGSSQPGASYPAYLLDLRNAGWASRGAVTLHVLPPASKVTRKALNGVINLGESRWPTLEVGDHPWSASIIAAHGDTGGRLDDLVPAAVQEKLVRAAAHGFFLIHVGNGKAAFATLSDHRDVEQQIDYLSEWL